MRMNILIRLEEDKDQVDVKNVNLSAFKNLFESNLVDALRKKVPQLISLVAVENETVVGHIVFSPVSLSDHPDLKMMGLAPMAVIPEYQRKGIGSNLVRAGLEHCRQQGFIAVVVLGHPEFYPRFGFTPTSKFGIDSDYDVPEEVFMLLELQPNALQGRTGKVKYNPVFKSVS